MTGHHPDPNLTLGDVNISEEKKNEEDMKISKGGERIAILEETLARLRLLYAREGLDPGVLLTIGLKPQWNIVIGTRGLCGMAINFTGIHQVYDKPQTDLEFMKQLVGRSLMEVAQECIGSRDLQMKSIGIAAMGALSQPFLTADALEKRGFRVWESQNYLQEIITTNDIITLVGLGGMVRRLIGRCKELYVTDMRPPESFRTILIGENIDYGPRAFSLHGAIENEALLSRSDVVLITASSLVNGTFNDLMKYSVKARKVGLYGPSASMIPDLFFEKGVDFIMTHQVNDPERFIDGMVNDVDMETALRNFQRHQAILPGKRV